MCFSSSRRSFSSKPHPYVGLGFDILCCVLLLILRLSHWWTLARGLLMFFPIVMWAVRSRGAYEDEHATRTLKALKGQAIMEDSTTPTHDASDQEAEQPVNVPFPVHDALRVPLPDDDDGHDCDEVISVLVPKDDGEDWNPALLVPLPEVPLPDNDNRDKDSEYTNPQDIPRGDDDAPQELETNRVEKASPEPSTSRPFSNLTNAVYTPGDVRPPLPNSLPIPHAIAHAATAEGGHVWPSAPTTNAAPGASASSAFDKKSRHQRRIAKQKSKKRKQNLVRLHANVIVDRKIQAAPGEKSLEILCAEESGKNKEEPVDDLVPGVPDDASKDPKMEGSRDPPAFSVPCSSSALPTSKSATRPMDLLDRPKSERTAVFDASQSERTFERQKAHWNLPAVALTSNSPREQPGTRAQRRRARQKAKRRNECVEYLVDDVLSAEPRATETAR
ncbi:hypothetical protein LshimejAT787_0500470 [Lyophyllum shimeji]|uniref:Uncharacterized protein n=1 Tax=Lyophyllum shimeji TaxID=47721 RepID=A0A9P3PKW6_LYOSH|nr:hypothetical protein LshimejAT787_0500470 [Lyophyllum shimeji]